MTNHPRSSAGRTWIGLSALTGVLLLATPVLAQPATPANAETDELPRIVISDPNRDLFRLALPDATGEGPLARSATEIESRDLTLSGLFRVLDPVSFPATLQKEGMGFSSALWTEVGAQGVAKMGITRQAGGLALEGRLYQVGRGESPVLNKTYRGAELRTLVHAWANDVIAQLTGQRGVFGARIAFAMGGKKGGEIASVGMDGAEMTVLTQMHSPSLMPAYSPTGGQVAFTSFLMGGADLWVVSAGGGRARRISSRSGMNSGAAWFPGGGSLVATLSFEGNAELYRLGASDGAVQARLTNSPAIDLSANVSPDGSKIAFVSDRQGTPQLFIMPSSGGGARRLTFQGTYNQTPRFCPRADTPIIAFTGRDERLVFDIFTYDLRTGKIDRLTQNQGSNEDPTWSPDCRLVVYSSSRGGLFGMNPQAKVEHQIWKGSARSPSFGPAPGEPR
jgi:TolB protein